ncbi:MULTISPECIES: HAMP domain-containing sensor histidine kinase [unclassified Rhodanobacter]|uniref:sensor histidine kinase n=1 Tax=unclassified Rhodanobacter TaxID=2621553 RepID=UPI001BDE3C6A|nr:MULTISPECIES: HAMP domain-containing sensor histidine kinase [unclassified Rhodanobacter]MBT2143515.1 HAMP domain-containing histidine kinase [Rhodanobacter sp. LX-99]MBT2147411.1 HAMP domain-containing histidine kinase [Rhodanobacter sp. LX-100]
MQSRRKLRFRLIVSFALFGFGLSALFAVAALNIRAKVESQLVTASLQQDVDQAVEKVHKDPTKPAGSDLIEAWMRSDRTLYNMPLSWQALDSGVHDIYETGADGTRHHYKLAVRKKYGLIGFIRYDVTRDELGKQQLLFSVIGAVFLFGLLSLVLGLWLSRKVLKPVSELANRLRDFRKAGKAEPLAPHFADDEVGELAHALDEYSARLTAMVERDREFNSDVSHELRTPLAVIASTTELLQGSPDLTEKLSERLKRIERASRQATELIEALLLLSRAERRGPTRGETTEVGKVAADVIESQRPQMRGKPLSIELAVSEPVNVNAPASVLSVALTNLVGNAIKYTLEGSVRVEVGDGRIEVIDTGPGIKPEDAERLFQRGVRGEGAGGSGAGLGLAIVRRLCELYGWDVSMRPRADANGAIASIKFS